MVGRFILFFIAAAFAAPSILPYLEVDPITFCAGGDDYLNTAICSVRLINNGATLMTSGEAFLEVTGGRTLEDELTGEAGVCKSFASLGRQNTTVAMNGTLPSSTISVTSTAGFASSNIIRIFNFDGIQEVTCTGISGNSFTGCTGGSGALIMGAIVQGTSNGGLVDQTDIIFATTNDTVFGPTTIQQVWSAPQEAVAPPSEFILFQVAMPGDGIQTVKGSVSFSVNSQIPTNVPVCCGCCSPKCPCNIWREPQNVTGPLCDYENWLATGGYACSACKIRLVKSWNYCQSQNEIKYGARFEVVNPYGVTFPLGVGTFTVQEQANCTACGTEPESCYISRKK